MVLKLGLAQAKEEALIKANAGHRGAECPRV